MKPAAVGAREGNRIDWRALRRTMRGSMQPRKPFPFPEFESRWQREWLATGPKTKGNLRLEVDVDPQSFL